jgi:hypothetical protein
MVEFRYDSTKSFRPAFIGELVSLLKDVGIARQPRKAFLVRVIPEAVRASGTKAEYPVLVGRPELMFGRAECLVLL